MSIRSSSISWLVFNDSDIQDARRLIDELDTSDSTVDTLGFGTVLESLSDIFFPATSTLHRNIRYQIFIPSLIWSLQRQKHSDARLSLKKLEFELQRALVDSGQTQGVIGRTRRESLKYWPSLLYWNATNKLQMFGKGTAFSMDEVFHILQKTGEALLNDDKEADESHFASTQLDMDADLKEIAAALFEKKSKKLCKPVTFRLTESEALYLKKRFQDLFPRSITSHLLDKTSRTIFRITSPFKLTSTSVNELNELVRQAEQFSKFAMGATYAYRWVLCEHLRSTATQSSSKRNLAISRDHAENHFTRWKQESADVLKWSYSDLAFAAKRFDTDLSDPKLDELQRKVLHAAQFKGSARQALQSLKKSIRGISN
jgi:hypothetical protein